MGNFSVIMTLLLGIKFIVRPVMTTKGGHAADPEAARVSSSPLSAASIVGFICGFIGAGGGMMMLLLLTGVHGL